MNKIKKKIRNVFFKLKFHFWYSTFKKQLLKSNLQQEGNITLFEKPFYFHYGKAFYETYNEIFLESIYQFTPKRPYPKILDCGANMGLSLLFFCKNYPDSKIIAFEPDPLVLPFLEKNIVSQNLKSVQLSQKAVWIEETTLKFYSDNGLGGRIGLEYKETSPVEIQTVRLRDYLKEPIDFLKIDIEGAEFQVLEDCEDLLSNVDHLFVEYHSFFDEQQQLDDVLKIIKNAGFRYHLKESFSRRNPFIDQMLVGEKFDMAINIFAYR